MPRFRYAAVDAKGKTVRGLIDANSKGALADHFVEQDRYLIEAIELKGSGKLANFLHGEISFRRGLGKRDIAAFTRQLGTMLSAGQDIDRALNFILETADKAAVRQVVEFLRNEVRGGKSLATALADQSRIFSPLYISLVRAGEAGGRLADSLEHLADLMERDVKLSNTIQSAMIYPAMLSLVAIGTLVVLLGIVVPQFAPIFTDAGAKIPPSMQFLLTVSDLLRDYGVVALLLIVAAVIGFRHLLAEEGFRQQFDQWLLRLPIIGIFIKRSEGARFTRTLGTLLVNGVSLLGALNIVRDVLANKIAVNTLIAATTRVKSGVRLSSALRDGKFFPAETIHMINLGEETGKLGEMALRCAAIHDDQVSYSVQSMVSILVPAITVIMGLFVGDVVASLLLAMLSLNDLAV